MTRRSGLLAAGIILLASCATTTISGVWRDPKFAGPPLQKVLVCAMSRDVAMRHRLEDTFVAELRTKGVVGTQCYDVLPEGKITGQQVRDVVTSNAMDGLIVTEVTAVKQVPVYGFGPAYYGGPFYDSWGPDWDSVYGPEYIETQTVVRLQTKAYSARQNGTLIWVGSSQTVDPASFKSLISDAVGKFIDSMAKADVLPGTPPKPTAIGDAR